MARSALEQLRNHKHNAQITEVPAGTPWGPEGSKMVISTPAEIDGLMAQVPKGSVTTLGIIREVLAAHHGAAVTCPLTTGIFANIVMGASEELAALGEKNPTPWWRTVKADGSLNPKAPGGVEGHKGRLEAEGIALVAKGRKNWRVAEIEKALFRPEI